MVRLQLISEIILPVAFLDEGLNSTMVRLQHYSLLSELTLNPTFVSIPLWFDYN